MSCPDKSYHVPGDEQRNVFWPELAKLPPQLYSLNYSLGKRNGFWIMQTDSQSTGIWCLRIGARLPPAFVSDPFTKRTSDLWTKSSVRSLCYRILKIKQSSFTLLDLSVSYFPCTQEACELCNLFECLAHSQAVPYLISEMLA